MCAQLKPRRQPDSVLSQKRNERDARWLAGAIDGPIDRLVNCATDGRPHREREDERQDANQVLAGLRDYEGAREADARTFKSPI